MKRSWTLLPGLLVLLTGCFATTRDSDGKLAANDAIALMTIEEKYVFNTGAAILYVDGEQDLLAFRSLADRSGGPGDADIASKGHIESFRALEAPAGQYELSHWVFYHRRGLSEDRSYGTPVKLEAGKVYYLGHFSANNLLQTAEITSELARDENGFRKKFPFLEGKEIIDLSENFRLACWPMNITKEIIEEAPMYAEAAKACYQKTSE